MESQMELIRQASSRALDWLRSEPGPHTIACVRALWVAISLVVMAPLALAFIQCPLPITDVFTGPEIHYSPSADFTSARKILPNYWHGIVRSKFMVRPTQVLLNNLQYVALGPEFGAMYAVKWSLKLASISLLLAILRRLRIDALSRYAAGALALFHPSTLDPILWSADGLVVLFMVALVFLTLRFSSPETGVFRIDQISRAKYSLVLSAWFLLLGAKEVALVVCLGFVMLWQVCAWRSRIAWLRLAPFYGLLLFWMYRLAEARPKDQYVLALGEVAGRLVEHLRWLCPPSPGHCLAGLCLGLLLLSARAFRRGDAPLRTTLCLALFAAAGMLAFLSIPAVRGSGRYMISVIYALAILAAAGMTQLPRAAWLLKPALLLLLPAWMAGDLYSQTLAFVEDMQEFGAALGQLETGAREGYAIACSGDQFEVEGCMGNEIQDTVKLHFEKYGPAFFGLPAPTRVYFVNRGDKPPGPYRLLTTYSPETLKEGAIRGLDLAHIEGAVQTPHDHQGLLARLTRGYTQLAKNLGNDHWAYYDLGTWVLTDKPRFFVYTVSELPVNRSAPLTTLMLRPAYRYGAFMR